MPDNAIGTARVGFDLGPAGVHAQREAEVYRTQYTVRAGIRESHRVPNPVNQHLRTALGDGGDSVGTARRSPNDRVVLAAVGEIVPANLPCSVNAELDLSQREI